MAGRLIVRDGDTSDHGGEVVAGQATWKCEGDFIARKGDILICPLHGPVAIVEGSDKWKCVGKEIARDGDHAECGARLISGAAKWHCD